jgi:hypothetical protein
VHYRCSLFIRFVNVLPYWRASKVGIIYLVGDKLWIDATPVVRAKVCNGQSYSCQRC